MCKCVGVQPLDAHLHICVFALFLKEKVVTAALLRHPYIYIILLSGKTQKSIKILPEAP